MNIHEIPFNPANGTPKVAVIIKPYADQSVDPWRETFSLRVAVKAGNDVYIAKPLEFEKRDDMAIQCDEPPVLVVTQRPGGPNAEIAQSIMDQLWAAGVRPKDIGTPGHLAATQAHLQDFRAIVGKTLGIELK